MRNIAVLVLTLSLVFSYGQISVPIGPGIGDVNFVYNITGPTRVKVGEQCTYNLNSLVAQGQFWSIIGGTTVSSTSASVTVKWTSVGSGRVAFVDADNRILTTLSVTVNTDGWKTNGTNVYVLNDKVGIGTSSPNSNTKLDVRGMIGVGREGIGGTYNSTQVQGIWSIAPNYKISTSLNDFGSLYGIGYAHTNAGAGSKKPISGFGHQIVYANNGSVNASVSLSYGHAYFKGNVGIGTTSPGSKLDVAGGRVEFTATTDATKSAGSGVLEIANTLRIDGNEIITNENTTLYLQNDNNGDLKVDGTTLVVDASTNCVGIGTTDTKGSKLGVNGTIAATEIIVATYSNWPDFVFGDEYSLPKLSDVEAFVNKNNHLPNVPSAAEVKETGVALGEMNKILLQKIEELTLYIIEQNKRIEELENKIIE